MEIDRSYNLSETLPNAANITGESNYWLPIYDSSGENIVHRLWFLDSGVYGCLNVKDGNGCIEPD